MIGDVRIEIVAAMSEKMVIGASGGLPWSLPDDLKRFKQLTVGKPVVMGRKTYESIGRPLPHRLNVVISRTKRDAPGVIFVSSPEEAVEAAKDWLPLRLDTTNDTEAPTVAVIGGAEIYQVFLRSADRVCLTLVHDKGRVVGDTLFPEYPTWLTEASREFHPADERHVFPFTFLDLVRQ
jgi:dihydrofolate reductase